MLFRSLAVMTIAAVAVNAQIAGITPCILACVTPAAAQNGCSFTDPACVCASAQFQADAAKCLTDNCPAADVTAALTLQSTQCGAIGVSASGTATPNPVSFTAPPGGSSTPASGSSTPASTPATTTKPATSPAASQTSPVPTPSKSTGSAASMVANGGVFFGALLAGVLAL